MKQVGKIAALVLIGVVSAVWVIGISVVGPHSVAVGVCLVGMKVSGQASHLDWDHVVWWFLPDKLRGSWLPHVQDPAARGRVPVREVTRSQGACGTLWETPVGRFWGHPNEGDLLAFLVEEETAKSVYHRPPVAVQPGDVVIDGGAHIGLFSRSALSKGARKVIAVEPDPNNVECLKRNFEEELRQGRLVVVRKALWNAPGALQLWGTVNSARGAVSEQLDGRGQSVPATTLDDTVAELKLERVDFIKLDIEGAERHALAGAVQTLRRVGPRMVLCTYHRADDPVKITETVLRIRPSYWVFATDAQAYFYEGARDLR